MNRIPIANQAGALRSYFPKSKVNLSGNNKLTWVHTVMPTPISQSYKLKMTYEKGDGVNVYVINPSQLTLAEGKTRLPHVYSHKEQRLCLYRPGAREKSRQWSPDMFFVKTIIPWAVEWFEFYEYWLGTGEWLGGGIHPKGSNEEYDYGQTECS